MSDDKWQTSHYCYKTFKVMIIAGNKALHDTASVTKALITETKSQTENSPGSWNE